MYYRNKLFFSFQIYRNEYCTPKPIVECMVNENEIVVPMRDVLHHQIKKVLKIYPNVKEEMEDLQRNNPHVKFRFIFKYGM